MKKFLVGTAVLAVACLPARSALFTNDTLISFSDTNYEGQDIAMTNCAVTIDGTHTFKSVRIWSGGRLTHSTGTNGLLENRFCVSNELQVLSGATPVSLSFSNLVTGTLVVAATNGSPNFLAVSTIAPVVSSGLQDTNLVINWVGIPGVTYDGFYSTDLINWFSYASSIPGINGPMQIIVPLPFLNQPYVFFRLRASN